MPELISAIFSWPGLSAFCSTMAATFQPAFLTDYTPVACGVHRLGGENGHCRALMLVEARDVADSLRPDERHVAGENDHVFVAREVALGRIGERDRCRAARPDRRTGRRPRPRRPARVPPHGRPRHKCRPPAPLSRPPQSHEAAAGCRRSRGAPWAAAISAASLARRQNDYGQPARLVACFRLAHAYFSAAAALAFAGCGMVMSIGFTAP